MNFNSGSRLKDAQARATKARYVAGANRKRTDSFFDPEKNLVDGAGRLHEDGVKRGIMEIFMASEGDPMIALGWLKAKYLECRSEAERINLLEEQGRKARDRVKMLKAEREAALKGDSSRLEDLEAELDANMRALNRAKVEGWDFEKPMALSLMDIKKRILSLMFKEMGFAIRVTEECARRGEDGDLLGDGDPRDRCFYSMEWERLWSRCNTACSCEAVRETWGNLVAFVKDKLDLDFEDFVDEPEKIRFNSLPNQGSATIAKASNRFWEKAGVDLARPDARGPRLKREAMVASALLDSIDASGILQEAEISNPESIADPKRRSLWSVREAQRRALAMMELEFAEEAGNPYIEEKIGPDDEPLSRAAQSVVEGVLDGADVERTNQKIKAIQIKIKKDDIRLLAHIMAFRRVDSPKAQDDDGKTMVLVGEGTGKFAIYGSPAAELQKLMEHLNKERLMGRMSQASLAKLMELSKTGISELGLALEAMKEDGSYTGEAQVVMASTHTRGREVHQKSLKALEAARKAFEHSRSFAFADVASMPEKYDSNGAKKADYAQWEEANSKGSKGDILENLFLASLYGVGSEPLPSGEVDKADASITYADVLAERVATREASVNHFDNLGRRLDVLWKKVEEESKEA